MDISPATAHSAATSHPPAGRRIIALVMMLFFAFGFCTVLVDTLVPKLKGLFSLTYTEAMLTQFCFFGAYFIVSLPAARLIRQLGYLESVTLGLAIMAGGCLAFTPAAEHGSYPAFLLALFVLAAGVTIVQVAANPLAARVGDPRHAHSPGWRPAGRWRQAGPELRHPPKRHVQLLGPECLANAASAQRVRHLRRGFRPHLRRRAEREEPAGRCRGHGGGAPRLMPAVA